MNLLFLHGWGFDRHLWDALRPLLPQGDHAVDDRGYFCAQHRPEITAPCLAVTHSFGTMRLLDDPPAGLVGLVAINGFSRFARSEAGPGVPRRVIAQMLAGFDADPARVLRQFRAGCGVADAFPAIDAAMLRDDLVMLRDGTAPTATVPVLSLEGGRDHLLDPDTRAAQFLGTGLERREHPDAGHMLPLTHPAWCAQQIGAFAGALAS
ncbi:alpha/beta fold hydrolase [Novosphingobium colocasiae]|uniref:alpha/beta fold hydrolase n=1 Tax=Novosphingobium colocasiae TaxID=1256513 RepID=UPI0035B3C501